MKTIHVTIAVMIAGSLACEREELSLGEGQNTLTSVPCDRCDPALYPPNLVCPQGAKAPCLTRRNGTCGWDSKCPGGPPVVDCSGVPQCELLCPPNTTNPVDERGCKQTCKCVADPAKTCPQGQSLCEQNGACYDPRCLSCCMVGKPAPDAGAMGQTQWHATCGDPVCGAWRDKGVPPCPMGVKKGERCATPDDKCDPMNACNSILVCTSTDPTNGGQCPISRASYKRDIRYLGTQEVDRYRDELLRTKLATWRYKHDPSRERLGFIIDDQEGGVAVDTGRDMVDLYGYTSLAVAAVQAQAREISALKRHVATLEAKVALAGARARR